MLRKLWQHESGQALATVAVALAVLIGFSALVVDVGSIFVNQAQCSNIVDAAALAGAQLLPGDPVAAEAAVRSVATANGLAADRLTISTSADQHSISVQVKRDVPFSFARTLGFNGVEVGTEAEAQVGVAASVPWIVPFVIPKPPAFNFDQVYVMRMYGAGPYYSSYNYPGDYRNKYPAYPKNNPYPYQFDYMNVKIHAGASFSDYLKYLEKGYHETFTVGQDMFYLDPSSGGQASVDTFAKRIANDPNSDYTKAKVGDPRVMLIPVVNNMLPRNTRENTRIRVIGFVGFFLEKVYKNSYGETFWFEGRFLKDLNVGTGEVTFDSDADFGLRAVKLVR